MTKKTKMKMTKNRDEQRKIRAIAEEIARSLALECILGVQVALRAYARRGPRMRPRAS